MRFLRRPQFWVVTAISLACLVLAFRHVPLAELGRSLAHGNYLWLVPALAFQVAGTLSRSQRWVVLLKARGHLADSFWSQGIGYLFTNILPFRMGEPARVLAMSQRCNLPFFQVASSAVVERLLDASTCVTALVVILPFVDVPVNVARAGVAMGILALAGLGVLLLAAHSRKFSEVVLPGLIARIRWLPSEKILRWWREIVVGLASLTNWRMFGVAVFWSLTTWFLAIATNWATMRVVCPAATLVEAAFLIAVLAFAVSVPSSPGFIGVFQLAGQQALVLPFGGKYDAQSALAIALLCHVFYYLFSTSMGLVGLWKLNLSFAGLSRMITGKEARPTAA
ncbi:MAG: lysylphosphatidylglycerol synthase transmembrane domain-containing protein [Verrucomicrobiota bacterium]